MVFCNKNTELVVGLNAINRRMEQFEDEFHLITWHVKLAVLKVVDRFLFAHVKRSDRDHHRVC